MPVVEFVNLSDRELSDIVAYIRSEPPVNRDMGAVRLGPVFAFLIATDPKALGAFTIDHEKAHAVEPPAEVASAELGRHIVQVCRGCHGENLSGGKLAGDPDMPIVANLTPHETGLKGWVEADFIRAIREGKRKDGTDISRMMPWQAYGRMTDTELKAIWAYLQTVPPREKGNH
jgi:mono/diheme cytochrome c family protein